MSKIETALGNSSEIGAFERGFSIGGCAATSRVFFFISSSVAAGTDIEPCARSISSAHLVELDLRVLVGRVELHRLLELDQRALEDPGLGEAPARGEVLLGGADLGAHQRRA